MISSRSFFAVGYILTLYFSMNPLPQLRGDAHEVLALRAGGNLLLGDGELPVQVDQRLLTFKLLDIHNDHIAGPVAGDIYGLSRLTAEVGDLISAVAKIRDRSNAWHNSHILSGIV